MATKTTKWTPNELQTKFLKVLKDNPDKELSLQEIAEIMGVESIATGSVNTLLSKGITTHGEEKEIEVKVKRKVHTYKLAPSAVEIVEEI